MTHNDDLSVIDGAMVFMTTLHNHGQACYIPEFLKFIDSTLGQDVYEEMMRAMLNPAPKEEPKIEPFFALSLRRGESEYDKIGAIKALRNFTLDIVTAGYNHNHLGLKEAKDFVDSISLCSETLHAYAAPVDVIRHAVIRNKLSNFFHVEIIPA